MVCVLQVNMPALTTFLDPGPDLYLSTVVPPAPAGSPGTAVACSVFPVTPANQVVAAGALPRLLINGTSQPFTVPPISGNPMLMTFSVGNKPAIEAQNSWNSINISVQDNTGAQTSFSTFWYFISGGMPPPPPLGMTSPTTKEQTKARKKTKR
jgi:hypothetical protein